MANGSLVVDSSALAHNFRAGGAAALDKLTETAKAAGMNLVASDVVVSELKDSPDYFVEQKAPRASQFSSWLAQFQIVEAAEPSTAELLDIWFEQYAFCLAPKHSIFDPSALSDFNPTWEGRYRHLNVIWDISIILGDMICARVPHANWRLDTGYYEAATADDMGYLRPCIQINGRRRSFSRVDMSERVHKAATVKRKYPNRPNIAIKNPHFLSADTLRQEVGFWTATDRT
jgi:hypothetical protein